MTMRFKILSSSSSGNCALLRTATTTILIDAGLTGRQIETHLAAAGVDPASLDAIFITHEHGDHTRGLTGLTRRHRPRVFANRDTARALADKCKTPPQWTHFTTGETFTFRDLTVQSFTVPHDASDPVGFVFSSGEETLFSPRRRLAWVTDLGYVPTLVRERLRDVDCLVLEANHDPELLDRCTTRPWSVKQRIKGRHGHLSNQAAMELVSALENPRLRHVYLAHLSRDCNAVERVHAAFGGPRAYNVTVVDPSGSTCEELDLGAWG